MSAVRWLVFGLFCSFAVAWLSGCGGEDGGPITAAKSQYEVGNDSTGSDPSTASVTGTPSEQGSGNTGDGAATASEAGIPPDPFSLPLQPNTTEDLGPLPNDQKGLTALLDELRVRQPRGTTRQEWFASVVNIQRTRIEAAEKLWKMSSDKDARLKAAHAKLESMRILNRMGPSIEKEIHAYCRTLQEEEDPELKSTARLTLFDMAVDQLVAGEIDDEQAILTELKSLVKEGLDDPSVFVIVGQAAMKMQRAGNEDAATEAARVIGNAFKGNPDPQIAEDANGMIAQARLADMDYNAKLQAMLEGKPNSVSQVKEVLNTVLSEGSPGRVPLAAARYAAQMMEMDGHFQDLAEIHTMIENAYKDHPKKDLVEESSALVKNGRLRVGLFGKPFSLEGTLPDGSELDWSKFQGKVVLVDFWATWCEPCLQEINNIRARYDEYREKGFEVVGVNVDNNPQDLALFLRFQSLPWPTIVNPSADPAAPGLTHPVAIQCGMEMPPFTVLVGQDGNVNAIHVRGSNLSDKLAELLGPPAEDAAKTPAGNQSSLVDPTGGQELFFVSFQEEADDEQDDWKGTNPYLPGQGLSPSELVDFILDMQDKPKSIQARPGFAEAIIEAAGRILSAESKEKYREIAAQARFDILHAKACLDDEKADKDLMAFVQELKEDKNQKISAEVQFFLLERKAIDVDELPIDEVPGLLDELKGFLTDKNLADRHLRMASSTVKAINRLEDGDRREEYFQQFGELFGKSEAKKLASYGKKLGKKPEAKNTPLDLAGKPLELNGVTALGTEFDWTAYRGKTVLVFFWATWCGPCRQEMPQIKALQERLSDRGFDIVGISLDRNQGALAKYLEENAINWTNLVGKEVRDITKKYGVRGVPTMILVDRDGNVVLQGNKIAELIAQAEDLLETRKS